jgi:amino acid transporter
MAKSSCRSPGRTTSRQRLASIGRGVFLTASLILAIATVANLRGLQLSGRMQLLLSAAVVALLVLAAATAAPRITAAAFEPFTPHGLAPIGLAALLLFFACFGWEAVAHLSAEFKDPRRDVPRATFIAVGVVTGDLPRGCARGRGYALVRGARR